MARQIGEDPEKVPGGGWTNRWGIPEPMAGALKTFVRGRPKLGTISCTELIDPPRKRELIRRHWNDADFTMDVGDQLQAFIGGAVHAMIESYIKRHEAATGKPTPFLVEESLSMSVQGWEITGRPDLYLVLPLAELDGAETAALPGRTVDPDSGKVHWRRKFPEGAGIIDDHKTTKAYKIQKGAKVGFMDWGNQLDIYAVLYRHHGWPVHLGRNLWYLKDWMRGNLHQPFYPSSPAGKIVQVLRTEEDANRYLEQRVSLHLHTARAANPDKDLPECAAEERWEKNPSYAVWKVNEKTKNLNKLAAKVFTQEDGVAPETVIEEAQAWVQKQNKPHLYVKIEERPGESTRCQRQWCAAWQVCPLGQKIGPDPDDVLKVEQPAVESAAT